MSQSDYIQYKKRRTVVKNQTDDFHNPIPRQTLTDLTSYMITKTIQPVNTVKPNYDSLMLPNKGRIFDMDVTISNCPNFILCTNTNTRPYLPARDPLRVLTFRGAVLPIGYRPLYKCK